MALDKNLAKKFFQKLNDFLFSLEVKPTHPVGQILLADSHP